MVNHPAFHASLRRRINTADLIDETKTIMSAPKTSTFETKTPISTPKIIISTPETMEFQISWFLRDVL